MIKYIGSKKKLRGIILDAIRRLPGVKTVFDVFSGAGHVSYACKEAGYRVISNDYAAYAHAIATCYIQADREKFYHEAAKIIRDLNQIKPKHGYFTEIFCEKSRFFQPKNGMKIDAIRDRIEELGLSWELKAILLTSLIEAADKVDSTVGVQMAYLKQWAPRSYKDIRLEVPPLLPRSPFGEGMAMRLDAIEAAKKVGHVDVAYIDPPYNQHSYLANYHIWETLVLWDKPPVYGKACKRIDVRSRKSLFNSKKSAKMALSNLVKNLDCDHLIISFNNEGFLGVDDIFEIMEKDFEASSISSISVDYRRYIGSKIGVYNLEGKKVGKEGPSRNKEYLFVATRSEHKVGIAQQKHLAFLED